MRKRVCAGILLTLSACAPAAPETKQAVMRQTEVAYDEYTQQMTVMGPPYPCEPTGAAGTCRAALTHVPSTEQASLYAINVTFSGSDWLFLNRATARGGPSFDTEQLDREVSGGAVTESLAVMLSKAYLEDREDSGLDIRVSGKRGHVIVQLPPHYIQGFLKKI